jgi:carboxymethylenebutenolidase
MSTLKTQQVEIAVPDGTKMFLHWAGPADGRPGPGLIVLQEAFGVNSHIRDVVARFAAQGFWVAAPELFHRTATHFEGSYTDFAAIRPHFEKISPATLEADSRATFDWLKSQPKVMGDKIAAIGFCLGGRAVFVANSALPLNAAISFYGGGIAPDLLALAVDQQGPLLFFWGGMDQHNPIAKTRAVADALSQAKKPHVHVEFSEADHGFFNDEKKSYHPNAAAEAWALTMAFLKDRLAIQ